MNGGMNKETLAQYRDLRREIEHLEKRLKKMDRIVTDKVKASNSDFPYQPIHVTIQGRSAEYTRLEGILRRRQSKCRRMALEVEEFIAGIEDSRTRMVFERRHIDGWSWQKISRSMGSADESYARKIHDRYIPNT